jgi:hypothetical protein
VAIGDERGGQTTVPASLVLAPLSKRTDMAANQLIRVPTDQPNGKAKQVEAFAAGGPQGGLRPPLTPPRDANRPW